MVLISGPGAGSSLSPHTLAKDASLTGLGSGHEWAARPAVCGVGTSSHVAHQLPGDAGRVSSIKYFLLELRDRHELVRTGNTEVVSYINHQGGLRTRPLQRVVHQILGCSKGKLLSLRTVHIPGHLNMGTDILLRQGPRPGEWMLHPEVVEQTWRVWPGSSGPVCVSKDFALSRLVLSDSSSSTGDVVSFLNGSLWRFTLGGISTLRRRVRSVTPLSERWKLWT